MSGHGNVVRAEALCRRDEVLLFGQSVEVCDVQSVRDFPTCVNLVIRPHGGQPRETLVPRDMLLLGMRLPRILPLLCAGGCKNVMHTPVDLAQGPAPQVVCLSCRGRAVEETAWFAPHGPFGRY